MTEAPKHWILYWVESDGFEDCFVVARNARSACAIEREMNGFDVTEVRATKVMRVPKEVERSYTKRSGYKQHPWPWYVYGKQFFKMLGAQFRIVEKQEEMLLDDVVYEVDEYEPGGIYRRRAIGPSAFAELSEIPGPEYDDEDTWYEPEIHLVTALGLCLIRCQQIENYITQSFLLGISKKQKSKYATLDDLKAGWRKKTLGNMLRCIEEAWEIDPLVKASFDLFLEHRNLLVHGITTSERFDIRTRWGQKELAAFLRFFDSHSRIVRKAFRASYLASLDFGVRNFGVPDRFPKKIFSKKQEAEIGLFFECFSPKHDCI